MINGGVTSSGLRCQQHGVNSVPRIITDGDMSYIREKCLQQEMELLLSNLLIAGSSAVVMKISVLSG